MGQLGDFDRACHYISSLCLSVVMPSLWRGIRTRCGFLASLGMTNASNVDASLRPVLFHGRGLVAVIGILVDLGPKRVAQRADALHLHLDDVARLQVARLVALANGLAD